MLLLWEKWKDARTFERRKVIIVSLYVFFVTDWNPLYQYGGAMFYAQLDDPFSWDDEVTSQRPLIKLLRVPTKWQTDKLCYKLYLCICNSFHLFIQIGWMHQNKNPDHGYNENYIIYLESFNSIIFWAVKYVIAVFLDLVKQHALSCIWISPLHEVIPNPVTLTLTRRCRVNKVSFPEQPLAIAIAGRVLSWGRRAFGSSRSRCEASSQCLVFWWIILTSIDLVGDGHEVEARLRRAAVGARTVGTADPRPAVGVRLARLHLKQQLPERSRRALAGDHAQQCCTKIRNSIPITYLQVTERFCEYII